MELDPVKTVPLPDKEEGEHPYLVITEPDGTKVEYDTIYAVEQVPVVIEHR